MGEAQPKEVEERKKAEQRGYKLELKIRIGWERLVVGLVEPETLQAGERTLLLQSQQGMRLNPEVRLRLHILRRT